MNNENKNIEILNDLIKINNDRISGYKKSIETLSPVDEELAVIFTGLISQSEKYKDELMKVMQLLGYHAEQGTTVLGDIYRKWIDLKTIFTGDDRHSILRNCELGEEAAQQAYQSALEQENLAVEIQDILENQKMELQAAYNHIKSLTESLS